MRKSKRNIVAVAVQDVISLAEQRASFPDYDRWIAACKNDAPGVYACLLCNREFAAPVYLTRHLSKQHKVTPERVDDGKWITKTDKIRHIRCEYCSMFVLFILAHLETHLYELHGGLSAKWYYEDCVAAVKASKIEKTSDSSNSNVVDVEKQDAQGLCSIDVQKGKSVLKDPRGQVLSLLTGLTDALSRLDRNSMKAKLLTYFKINALFRATHRCTDCSDEMKTVDRALEHVLLKDHAVVLEEYACKICSITVPMFPISIDEHMRESHHINLLQYLKLIHEPQTWFGASLLKCLECLAYEGTNEGLFRDHLAAKHDLSVKDYSEQYGSSTFAKSMLACVFCGKDVRHAGNYLKAHSNICPNWLGMPAFFAKWKAELRGEDVGKGEWVPKRLQPVVAIKNCPGFLVAMAKSKKRERIDASVPHLTKKAKTEDAAKAYKKVKRPIKTKTKSEDSGINSDHPSDLSHLLEHRQESIADAKSLPVVDAKRETSKDEEEAVPATLNDSISDTDPESLQLPQASSTPLVPNECDSDEDVFNFAEESATLVDSDEEEEALNCGEEEDSSTNDRSRCESPLGSLPDIPDDDDTPLNEDNMQPIEDNTTLISDEEGFVGDADPAKDYNSDEEVVGYLEKRKLTKKKSCVSDSDSDEDDMLALIATFGGNTDDYVVKSKFPFISSSQDVEITYSSKQHATKSIYPAMVKAEPIGDEEEDSSDTEMLRILVDISSDLEDEDERVVKPREDQHELSDEDFMKILQEPEDDHTEPDDADQKEPESIDVNKDHVDAADANEKEAEIVDSKEYGNGDHFDSCGDELAEIYNPVEAKQLLPQRLPQEVENAPVDSTTVSSLVMNYLVANLPIKLSAREENALVVSLLVDELTSNLAIQGRLKRTTVSESEFESVKRMRPAWRPACEVFY
jgi:hypothetical protein